MLNTASAVISFYGRLEDQAGKFYADLAQKYVEDRETFLAFAKESGKHKEIVSRAYQEVITDAIEAGFSFAGLNESDYQVKTELLGAMSYPDALQIALELEEKIHRFCIDASERSRSLLADIPQAFERVAKRKGERKLKLKELYDNAVS